MVLKDAELILVAHQRRDIGSCLCGWAELGKSHPMHQAIMLREAGLLRSYIHERTDDVVKRDHAQSEDDGVE